MTTIKDTFGNTWHHGDIALFMDDCFSSFGFGVMGQGNIDLLCAALEANLPQATVNGQRILLTSDPAKIIEALRGALK
jgi:Flp pilus assembly protein protease CpaA